jgi:diguanylate cyclase (GGDEF)-like protein
LQVSFWAAFFVLGLGVVAGFWLGLLYAHEANWVGQTLPLVIPVLLAVLLWRVRPLAHALLASRAEARANAELLRAAMNGIHETFTILSCVRDAQGRVVDFQHEYLNDAAVEMIGRPLREGETLLQVSPELRGTEFLGRLVAVAESGEPFDAEIPGPCGFSLMQWVNLRCVRVGDGLAVATRDVSQAKAAEPARQELELRFSAAAESGLDALVLFDAVRDEQGEIVDFRFRYLNRVAERLIRRPRGQVIGERLCELLPINREPRFFPRYKQAVDTGEPFAQEVEIEDAAIAATWVRIQVVPVGDGFALTARDISERKQLEASLRQLAHFDSLTGLPNRALYYETLHHSLATPTARHRPLLVMFIDVDHFKQINDDFGHAAGDAVLIEVARRLKGCADESSTVARLAGDEFTVVAERLQENEPERLAQAMLTAMATPVSFGGHLIRVSLSIGGALLQEGTAAMEVLLAEADQALYQVKRQGRNGSLVRRLAPPDTEPWRTDIRRQVRKPPR